MQGGALATRTRPLSAADGVLPLGLAVLLGYFVAPDVIAGATFIHVRAMVFLLFALVAAVAVRPPAGPLGTGVAVALVGVSLALLGLRAAHWHEAGGQVAERVAVLDALADDGLILHVQAALPPDEGPHVGRTRPLAHLVGWSASKRPRPAPRNYEAGTGHFPLVWAPGRDPRPALGDWLGLPPQLDLPAWEARGGRVGYVMVSEGPLPPRAAGIAGVLDREFEVAQQGAGWVLHRRRSP